MQELILLPMEKANRKKFTSLVPRKPLYLKDELGINSFTESAKESIMKTLLLTHFERISVMNRF